MFEVIFGGAETTVQDAGRLGVYRYGICPSGAQDNFSYRMGNILLRNRENATAFEITVVGPKLEVQRETAVVFTGAQIPPKINGEEVDCWKAIRVKPGDLISFGPIRAGCRAYICVAGGIDVPVVFGSRSTGILNGIGGFKGRKLEKGDLIPTFRPEFPPQALDGATLPTKYLPRLLTEATLRTIPGMYDYLLTGESLSEFFKASWKIAFNSNRVGYYLVGPEFDFKPRKQPFGAGDHPSNVTDIPYPIGCIQVPGGKHAVILLNDAVTGGGFATIGNIIKPDLDIVAQLKPRDTINFEKVGISEALKVRKDKQIKIQKIKDSLDYPF